MNLDFSKIEYIDTHCHLHDKAFDIDRELVIDSMRLGSISAITIGTDLAQSQKARDLASLNEFIYYTAGLHPHDNIDEFNFALANQGEYFNNLKDIASSEKCLAIGECGLDYFYIYRKENDLKSIKDLSDKSVLESIKLEKENQKIIFERHIDLANQLGLPLMLHIRPSEIDGDREDAYLDALEILKQKENEYGKSIPANFHFFVSTENCMLKILNELQSSTFSIPAVCTFTSEYDEMIKSLPINRMHIETDSPYVLPKSRRVDVKEGKIKNRNQPNFLVDVFEKVSEIKNLSEEEKSNFKDILKDNFMRLYIK